MSKFFTGLLDSLSAHDGSRLEKAIVITSAAKLITLEPSLTIKQICDFFEQAHLARPNPTVLLRALTGDRRVSVRKKTVRSLSKADDFAKELFPQFFESVGIEPDKIDKELRLRLEQTPLIEGEYVTELEKMLGLYATLHTLENSMRRLIEGVLKKILGENWWDIAASAPHKKKHADRLNKELDRKWVPTRSGLGPLYSLDWSDLISLIRKYEEEFIPYIGEIKFLHRYEDLGLIRHVIAHHGFVANSNDYERVKIALHDWQQQVTPAISSGF